MRTLSRHHVLRRLGASYAEPDVLQQMLDTAELPKSLKDWFGRLKLLYGVPINYLVPDEGMLPPESIRFFYLDSNWVDSLVDGAFSIGRNLTTEANAASMNLDRAAKGPIRRGSDEALSALRADFLGLESVEVAFQVISGFILRSSLVGSYPGLGVNAYPSGATPKDPRTKILDIVRMERLGPDSDTLICLFAGDAVQIDIHEAPEALHYGIDQFDAEGAFKKIHLFTKSGDRVTMSDTLVTLDLNKEQCIRPGSRTIKMATLAKAIAAHQQPPINNIDAAEMGFEMTEGVGSVSFKRKLPQP